MMELTTVLPKPGEPGRDLAAVQWLLAREARAGSTALRTPVLLSGLAALEVGDPAAVLARAAEAGEVVVDEAAALVSGAELAAVEEGVAEQVERLTVTADPARPGVVVVTGCCPQARQSVLRTLLERADGPGAVAAGTGAESTADALGVPVAAPDQLEDASVVVADEAQLLDVVAVAELLEHLADGAQLVLAGDAATLPSSGPGDVLADLVEVADLPTVAAAGSLPLHAARCPDAEAPPAAVASPAALAHAVWTGHLPAVESPDRALVVVPAADDAAAAHRVDQLVSTSIPRAFDVGAADIAVLTPLQRGPAGTRALGAALEGRAQVQTVQQAAGRQFAAVVAVFPAGAAGSLSRPLVHAALAPAQRHLSVVTAAGPALPRAVAQVPRRRRTTRLVGLLSAALPGVPG